MMQEALIVRLEIFNFVEDSLIILSKFSRELEVLSGELEIFFKKNLDNNDYFLNVSSRIKSPMSLKEKILRNNYYLTFADAQDFFFGLSDLIGVRLECRFIEDEDKLFSRIKEIFSKQRDDGYFYNEDYPAIMLNLIDKQPQIQKNGFEIFKIDGIIAGEGPAFHFELQIKSLVNMFWGEIEHKILYKNYNYMPIESFYRDIMSSIKGNITMIDRQLMILHDHLNEMNSYNSDSRKKQFESMVSKAIYELYSTKIKKQLGFSVDFRNTCDLITDYLLKKDREYDNRDYPKIITGIMARFNEIASNDLDFDEYLSFEREIFFDEDFESKLGYAIYKNINRDFRWNMLFRIIFDIEVGNNAEDFELFIKYLRHRFENQLCDNEEFFNGCSEYDKIKIIEEILDVIVEGFLINLNVDFIDNENIKEINASIMDNLDSIRTYEQWDIEKKFFLENLKQILN